MTMWRRLTTTAKAAILCSAFATGLLLDGQLTTSLWWWANAYVAVKWGVA